MRERRRAVIQRAYDVLDASGDGIVTMGDLEMRYNADLHPDVLAVRPRLRWGCVWRRVHSAAAAVAGAAFTRSRAPSSCPLPSPGAFQGKRTARDVLYDFMAQWDRIERDGVVTRDEFEDYYADVSACIDDDEYFERMVKNAWHLSDVRVARRPRPLAPTGRLTAPAPSRATAQRPTPTSAFLSPTTTGCRRWWRWRMTWALIRATRRLSRPVCASRASRTL